MEVDSRATHVTEDRLLRGASFLFNILFCIGLKPINNVVIVSGEQQRDSAIHIYVSILPQTQRGASFKGGTGVGLGFPNFLVEEEWKEWAERREWFKL